MNLYDINQEIMNAFENAVDAETGEIVNEAAYEALNTLQLAFDEKAEGILLWIKDLKAEAEALKKEKQAFEARQRAAENKAESLKKYIAGVLAGEKFKTPRVSVTYRKSESVEIEDLNAIPEDYLKYAAPTPDKTAIKAAIKAGMQIPGAWLMEARNIQIK